MTDAPEGVVVTQDSYTLRLYRCDGCACPTVQHGGTEMVRCAKPSTATGEWIAAPALAHTPTLRGEEVERLVQPVAEAIDACGNDSRAGWDWWENEARAAINVVLARTAPLPSAEVKRLRSALRSIAEGNLGDAPWQANYARIKEVAKAALSQPLAVDTGQSGEVAQWRENVEVLLSGYDGTIRARPGAGHEDLMLSLILTFNRMKARLAATPAPDTGQSGEAERLRETLSASLAKRSVATMDPPWSAAFNAALDMVARDTGVTPAPSVSPDPAGEEADAQPEMTGEERRLEDLKQQAAYKGPVVSFDVREPYYLASCDHCGWVGSSEHCGSDEADDVFCPRCFSAGADCGKVASSPIPKTFPREADLVEALAWFSSQSRLSLYHYSPMYCDDDDQSVEWRVDRESGPINDREWDTVARGETAQEAILAAYATASLER